MVNTDGSKPSSRAWLIAAVATVVVSAILNFHHLGAQACRPATHRGILERTWCSFLEGHAICYVSEANTGLVVQDMVERGNILFPLMNGQVPMRKPPLIVWLTAGYLGIMGRELVTPFGMRVQAATAGVLSVALVIGFGWKLLGPRAGVLAGLLLAGWYQFVARARLARADTALAFFDTLAMFALIGWLKFEHAPARSREARRRSAYHYLFALSLGLAVLTNRPVGVALPGLAILIWIAVERRWRTLYRLCAPGPLLAGATTAASWYAACAWFGRWDFLTEELATENLSRFAGGLGYGRLSNYLLPVLGDSWPLGMLAAAAVAYALIARSARAAGEARDHLARDAVRIFATYFLVTVVVLSVAAYK